MYACLIDTVECSLEVTWTYIVKKMYMLHNVSGAPNLQLTSGELIARFTYNLLGSCIVTGSAVYGSSKIRGFHRFLICTLGSLMMFWFAAIGHQYQIRTVSESAKTIQSILTKTKQDSGTESKNYIYSITWR